MNGDTFYLLVLAYAGVFGLCLGSFMNVCVARMPEDRSVVSPRSACPRCGTPIAWHDNVPVLAWFWLKGRCRACQGRISPLYPTVEALFGVMTMLLFRRVVPELGALDLPHLVAFVWYLYLLFALVALTFIDLRHYIIPDPFSIYAVPLGVGGAALLGHLGYLDAPTWQQSAVGALVGGCLLVPIMGAYYLIRKEQGMGWGDPKLLALIGSYFGAIPALAVVVLVGSVVGSVVGIFVAVARGEGPPPSVAKLALGAGIGLLVPPLFNGTLHQVLILLSLTPDSGSIWNPVWMLAGAGAGMLVVRMRAAVGDQGLRLQVPFGPFLVVGALVWLFGGPSLEVRVMPRMFGLDAVHAR